MAIADELAERGLSYRAALADLAVMLSRVAMAQRVEGVIDDADPLAEDLNRFAAEMHPDAVQLFYTIAVHSRSELAIAPDEYAGFVMACLRMLSLNGAPAPSVASQSSPSAEKKTPEKLAAPPSLAESLSEQAGSRSMQPANLSQQAAKTSKQVDNLSEQAIKHAEANPQSMALEASSHQAPPTVPISQDQRVDPGLLSLPMPWPDFAAQLPLSGMAAQLARQSELIRIQGRTLCLRVPTRALAEGAHADRLKAVLVEQLGEPLLLELEVGEVVGESAHAKDLARQQARQRAAEQAVEQDPFVRSLLHDFDGRVVPGSIQPGPSLQ